MLWTNPTPRRLLSGLHDTFVEPWASVALAAVVLILAVVGLIALCSARRRVSLLLAAGLVPYLTFHLVFQETFTTATPCRWCQASLTSLQGLSVFGLWR